MEEDFPEELAPEMRCGVGTGAGVTGVCDRGTVYKGLTAGESEVLFERHKKPPRALRPRGCGERPSLTELSKPSKAFGFILRAMGSH